MKTPNQIRIARNGSLHEQREQLSAHLASIDTPILVVIDDIDRLERHEIREILRLVRLTGNFPNVIYLLAFDRLRVEQAVSETAPTGPDSASPNFLDKIVQFEYEVPAIPPTFISRQLELGLSRILSEVQPLKIDPNHRFPKIYWELFAPIFTSMRDVKRYLGSLGATIRAIGDRVDLHDLLTLEAIRVLRPSLFAAIRMHRYGLAFSVEDLIPLGQDRIKERVQKAVHSLGLVDNQEYVDVLVKHLFQYAYSLVGRETSETLEALVSASSCRT